jgi:epsilon-lactone hydrolase
MQSWQADIVNTALNLSLKPTLKWVRSIETIRGVVGLGDRIAGRASLPRGSHWKAVSAPGTPCAMEWLDVGETETDPDAPVILYLPGGAYVLRTPHLHRGLAARICELAGTRALLCFYRLAPEHPFPACLDDAVAAYKLLRAEGIPSRRIIVAGDSAGGGLALSLLLRLRELGLPQPAGAILISPLLDMTEQAPSRSKNARSDAALPSAGKRGINPRDMYVGEEDHLNPLVSPIHGDLHDLPPCYVLVSDSEMLLDDSLRLARRAHQYRMSVKLDIWHKLPHVWVAIPWLPESKASLRRIRLFIDELFPDRKA